MNITNNTINMFRLVSANGKRSILEVLPQKAKTLKITGIAPLQYKSIPDGMPLKYRGFDYGQLERDFLKYGQTKSDALAWWFELITPVKRTLSRIEREMKKCFRKDNIDKIEFFKTLSPQERNYISEAKLLKCDSEFFAMLSGYKPAWYCEYGFGGKVDFSKIKLNPKIADKFDVVNLPNGMGLYFLNKKEVLKVIEENKDIYCAAQGLEQTAGTEVVYRELLKNLEKNRGGGDAIFGLTLGFPRHSSMIFEMEAALGGGKTELREDIPLFKEKLLELLHSDRSPFRGYPQETIEKLENHIKSMESIGSGTQDVFQCVTFGNEGKAMERFSKLENDFKSNFKMEDLM